MYAIERNGFLYRLTFSKSLAEHICDKYQYSLNSYNAVVGKLIQPGEQSTTGFYGLLSSTGILLRVSMIKEISEMHYDGESRFLCEVKLQK